MTEENLPNEEFGVVEDDTNRLDQSPPATSRTPDPLSAEPKGYADVAETDSAARQEGSISGEEEDFLSE